MRACSRVNGSAACTLCKRGKYSTATAAISEATCQGCPSYTYSPDGSGLPTNCTCNKGYTGPDGVACAACIAGTYKDVNGSAPCSLCSEGKYSTGTGEILESTCSPCPAGEQHEIHDAMTASIYLTRNWAGRELLGRGRGYLLSSLSCR